jgi:hypothetical protein
MVAATERRTVKSTISTRRVSWTVGIVRWTGPALAASRAHSLEAAVAEHGVLTATAAVCVIVPRRSEVGREGRAGINLSPLPLTA